jgi:hypothetical protein
MVASPELLRPRWITGVAFVMDQRSPNVPGRFEIYVQRQ